MDLSYFRKQIINDYNTKGFKVPVKGKYFSLVIILKQTPHNEVQLSEKKLFGR